MSKIVGIGHEDSFGKEISKFIEEYTDEVREKVDAAVESVGKKTVEELKVGGDFIDRTGAYRKSWKVKIEKTRLGVTATVYAGQYYLTQLLEFGHVKQNGGRTRAFPHISTAEENARALLEEEVRKAVEG